MTKSRVDYMIANRRNLEDQQHQFCIKHGFAWKRPQNFKNCVVIRWKHRKRKKDLVKQVNTFIDYERIESYVAFCHKLEKRYKLTDERDLFLDSELKLFKAGIYCFCDGYSKVWAIPNSNRKIKYILKNLPSWAVVARKKP